MTAASDSLDLVGLTQASKLLEQTIDPSRTVCVPFATEADTRAAIVGLANAKGGEVLIGVGADDSRTHVASIPGIDPDWLQTHLAGITAGIDPSAEALIEMRTLPLPEGAAVAMVAVRQSPVPPHLDTMAGIVFVHQGGRPRPIAGRAELDQLFRKGQALNERAERLIEATAERLTLAHFGHYGVAVVACLREPAAEPYLWAGGDPAAFAAAEDPFIRHWGLKSDAARTSAGEVELRSEREICGLLRVGRAGYIVAGEILKRPHGDILGTASEVYSQVERLVAAACRVLGHSETTVIVPRLLCDGLKGTRIRATDSAGSETVPSAGDTLRVPGHAGDARDETYRQQLARDFGYALLAPFGIHDLPYDSR